MDALILTCLGLLLTAVGALYTTRASLRASRTTERNKDHGVFTIKVKNLGPGNATIKTMALIAYGISTDGRSDDDFVERMAQPIDMKGNPDIEFYLWEPGDTVGAGEELVIFQARIPTRDNDLDTTFGSLEKNIEVRATYRSFLGVPYALVSSGK